MIKSTLIFLLFFGGASFWCDVQSDSNWQIENDYEISFSGKKAEGSFSKLSGDIFFDPADITNSFFNVSVAVNTISTGNKTKDKHAIGESWFFESKFPEIQFKSTSIRKLDNKYEMTGDLEIRGITKPITFPFDFIDNESKGEFQGELTVNREAFGIEGNFFSFVVGSDFLVIVKVPVTKR